jgi:hypothetical protein
MKKHLLRTTTQIINDGSGTRRLILRNEVIRVLSRHMLELVGGGSSTDSEGQGACTDTTH